MRMLTVFVTALLLLSPSWADSASMKTLTKKAKAGDKNAQYDLAIEYLFGKEFSLKGIERKPDYAQAAKWLQKSAKQGNLKSQYLLGTLYERGRGVKKDAKQAFEWYKKAMRGGNMDAACPLAHLYEKMDIRPKDPEISRPCYMK